MSNQTPNMGLVQPTINVDSGLTWEQSVNNNSTIIDNHSHAPGYGVSITPTGLNINADLSFQGNSSIDLKSVVFTPQGSLATLNAVYCIGADLYYNDSGGNVVQMTSGGAVNATSSGISSGASTASFVSTVLVVNAAANTPANIQGASILLGNNVAASKFLTLSPPAAMAANFSLTLPSLPGSTNILTLDSSGNIAAVTNVDNSTIVNTANVIQVASHGVAQGNLALRATGSTVAAGGVATASGGGTSTSGTFGNVSGLSVTITTTGRPVMVMIQGDPAQITPAPNISIFNGASSNGAQFQLYNSTSSSIVASAELRLNIANQGVEVPASMQGIDFVSAGTYTYVFRMRVLDGTSTAAATGLIIVAYEI